MTKEIETNAVEAVAATTAKVVDSTAEGSTEAMEVDKPADTISSTEGVPAVSDIPESSLNLPLARIKKIIKLDPEHISSTESANYLIGVATEMFIMNLAEKASFIAKTENRKKIQYKDFFSAINANENLLFLSDIIPKTQPLSELINQGVVSISEKKLRKNGNLGDGTVAKSNEDDQEEDDDDQDHNLGDEGEDGEGSNKKDYTDEINKLQEEIENLENGTSADSKTVDILNSDNNNVDSEVNNAKKRRIKSLLNSSGKTNGAPAASLGKGQQTLPFKKIPMSSVLKNSPSPPPPSWAPASVQPTEPVSEPQEQSQQEPQSKESEEVSSQSKEDVDVVMID
ncbi:nucleotidyltransferase activity protein [[Candida] boidinii]|nr:nucleotidyltransferase activity protein [[Candida] boidinii]